MSKNKIDNTYTFDNQSALAKRLGISRQTAYNRLKSNGWTGRLTFTSSELKVLKTRQNNSKNFDKNFDKKIDSDNSELVASLKAQIKSQNKTIDSLNEQLINSQKLQLLSQQQASEWQKQFNQLKLESQQPQGFWARLFHKQ